MMEEPIHEMLLQAADIIRYMGHPTTANAMIDLAVICRDSRIETSDDLEAWRFRVSKASQQTRNPETKPTEL